MFTKVRRLLISPQKLSNTNIFYEKGGEDADLIKSNIEFSIQNCQASAQLQNKSEFWPCVHFSHSTCFEKENYHRRLALRYVAKVLQPIR